MNRYTTLNYLFGILALTACVETVPTPPENIEESKKLQSGATLFESFSDARLRQDQQRARDLEASIKTLPGVIDARIHLTTPEKSLFGQTRPQKSGAAVLLVRDNHQRPSVEEVRAFIVAAIPTLSPESVHVFPTQRVAPTKQATERIGPIEVTRQSAKMARLIIGGLLLLCVLASFGLIGAGIKLLRLNRAEKSPHKA